MRHSGARGAAAAVAAPLSVPPYDASSEADRNELVAALVHTADLSGQAYAPHVAANWCARILAEFREEAAAARRLGLPVPPFMASLDAPLAGARVQLSFVTNVLLPLWQRVAELLPGPAMDEPLANLDATRRLYEAEVAGAGGGVEAVAVAAPPGAASGAGGEVADGVLVSGPEP